MKAENKKVIPIVEPVAPAIYHATVLSVTDESIVIDVSGVPQTAKLAFSCLVRPEIDDIVMYSQHESGLCYVLGIIERPGETEMSIDLPGDATIQTRTGSLSMISGTSVNLLAGKKINSISDQVVHKSREAYVDYDEITAKGKSLQASFTNIRVFSELMSSMGKQVIDKFKSYIRHSEDFDQVKAGQMTREVSGLYSMDSKYTILVSKKDTKIDGERIHMG